MNVRLFLCRRRILRSVGLLFGMLLAAKTGHTQTAQTAQTPPPRPAAIDPQTGVVHSQRLESGVPLGGLGTGTFQLMTDGAVSRATLTNNWNQPTGDLPGCFAAVWIQAADRTVARTLTLRNGYQLPSVSALDYDGLYPQARLSYPDTALPVTVSLRAFSPLIPFDLKNSSFPAAAFVFQLQNRSPLPAEISVAFSWENLLGAGGSARFGAFADRTGNRIVPIPDVEGIFGLRFTGPPLTRDNEVQPRMRDNATGEMALLALPPRAQATVTSAGWNTLEAKPGWWDSFAKDGTVNGRVDTGEERKVHPAGVVAVRLTLKPGDRLEIPFVVAWYTPHCYTTSGVDYGHFYEIMFPDAVSAGQELLREWRSLLALTEEWQNRLLFSSLPTWLSRRLINSVSPLTAQTLHTRDGSFAFLTHRRTVEHTSDKNTPDRIVDVPASLASIEECLRAGAMLRAFFPQKNVRMLQQFAALQTPDGLFPAIPDDWETALDRSGLTDERKTQVPDTKKPDREENRSPEFRGLNNTSAFVAQVAQAVLWTGDRTLADSLFPNVKKALLAWLPQNSGDGRKALPEAAATPASATLWLAALRAGQMLAEKVQDSAFAKQCETAFRQASEETSRQFGNGRYLSENRRTPQTNDTPAERLRDLSAADQMGGQWVADSLEAGLLLKSPEFKTIREDLARHNPKAQWPFGPVYRIQTDGALPPNDPLAGITFLAAAIPGQALFAIAHGDPDRGVALLQRLDDTRNNSLRSPWQSPASFRADNGKSDTAAFASLDHAADWNVLHALEGFSRDASAGHLTLSPQIPGTWRRFTVPLFAPNFRGRLDWKPTARGGTFLLNLERLIALPAAGPTSPLTERAKLTIRTLRMPGPPSRPDSAELPPPTIFVSLGATPVGYRMTRLENGDLLLTFETPLSMDAGDRLEVTVR